MTFKVLIIGGFGFVGGRVAESLSRDGHSIVLSSREEKAAPRWLAGSEVRKIDFENNSTIQHLFKDIDVVIHAAGMSAQECAINPVAALSVNGLGTARLVDAASRAGVAKFVYISTAHVYASPLVGVINEHSYPINLHPYATSHLAGENAVLFANDSKSIQGSVLRLSNGFGRPMQLESNCWRLLVNELCMQAVQRHKITLNTNGRQKRDFIAMTEVCNIVKELSIPDHYKNLSGIFNIGTGHSKSVLEIAKLIQERCYQVLGFKPRLESIEDGHELIYDDLQYNSVKLKKKEKHTNWEILEIDDLLRYCNSVV